MAQWQTEHTVCGWEHLKMPDRRCLILLRAFVKWPCWANRQNQQQVLLVVISPSLQKSPFVLFSTVTRAFFFWFSKKKKKKHVFQRLCSFKGSQLGNDLPVGRSVCTHFTLCSWPARPINGKKKTANNKTRKLHVRGKSGARGLPDSVAWRIKNVWKTIQTPCTWPDLFCWYIRCCYKLDT